jgi:hypothetical protein
MMENNSDPSCGLLKTVSRQHLQQIKKLWQKTSTISPGRVQKHHSLLDAHGDIIYSEQAIQKVLDDLKKVPARKTPTADDQDHQNDLFLAAINAKKMSAGFEFANDLRLKTSNQIDEGFKRRNIKFLETTFESYKDPNTGYIVASSLESALSKLGMKFHPADVAELYTSRGLNADGGLNFQDFCSVVHMPSQIEEWVSELPLSQLVADAMPRTACPSKDQLRHLSSTTQQQLEVSCGVITERLVKILEEHLAVLKEMYAKLDSKAEDDNHASEKFQVIKMNAGNIVNFHEGLAARIGEMRARITLSFCLISFSSAQFLI